MLKVETVERQPEQQPATDEVIAKLGEVARFSLPASGKYEELPVSGGLETDDVTESTDSVVGGRLRSQIL